MYPCGSVAESLVEHAFRVQVRFTTINLFRGIVVPHIGLKCERSNCFWGGFKDAGRVFWLQVDSACLSLAATSRHMLTSQLPLLTMTATFGQKLPDKI